MCNIEASTKKIKPTIPQICSFYKQVVFLHLTNDQYNKVLPDYSIAAWIHPKRLVTALFEPLCEKLPLE